MSQVNTPCEEWRGMVNDRGRAMMKVAGKKVPVVQVKWTLENGPIPPGFEPHHLCENKRCVNLGHIELVTKGRHMEIHEEVGGIFWTNRNKTECVNGHPYDEANTIWRKKGGRDCRACNAERQARYRAKRRARTVLEPPAEDSSLGIEVEGF